MAISAARRKPQKLKRGGIQGEFQDKLSHKELLCSSDLQGTRWARYLKKSGVVNEKNGKPSEKG